jgi:hypothetical protein
MGASEKNSNLFRKIPFVGAVEFSTVEYMASVRILFNMLFLNLLILETTNFDAMPSLLYPMSLGVTSLVLR